MPGQKFGPAWFPGLAAVGLGICGALLVAEGLRKRAPLYALPPWIGRAGPRRAVAAVVIGLVAYIVLAGTLGFHLTAVVVLALWLRTLGARWSITLSVAIVAAVVIHLAFYKLLRVPLPWGVLERWAF